MRVLGDKVGSTLLAQTAGVPTIPWNAEGMTADLLPDGTIPFDQFDAACIHTEQVRPAAAAPTASAAAAAAAAPPPPPLRSSPPPPPSDPSSPSRLRRRLLTPPSVWGTR